MLTLFKKYKDSGRLEEAYLVGQNLFNKNPGNEDVFDEYYSFLCTLAKSLPSFEDKQKFADQANMVLAFYKENVELNEITVQHILNYQSKLESIFSDIESIHIDKLGASIEEAQANNEVYLKEFFKLKDRLSESYSKDKFEEILREIGEVDLLIDKDALTADQKLVYDDLTEEYTELISFKMREMEHKVNVDYNKKAAEEFAKAIKEFRENESYYKNQTQLFSLVSTTLFAFDPAHLFNETLIYYNHIYSYIFSKLDDDGKLALTRYSIECERKMRYPYAYDIT